MKKLIEFDWKYIINLCAHDYPLKTNLEMVRQLKLLNGRNSIESRVKNSMHYCCPQSTQNIQLFPGAKTQKNINL